MRILCVYRCEAASTMCALSINDQNKIDMAKDDNVIQNMIMLLRETDIRCLRQAMGCLANISERQETHPTLRKNQVHNEILGYNTFTVYNYLF